MSNSKETTSSSILVTITVEPHAELCPEGKTFQGKSGESLLDVLLDNGISVEHACEKSCACTTCHVILDKGAQAFDFATDAEEDLLDLAWGLEPASRLSCQTIIPEDCPSIRVRLPKYTRNQVSERH